MAFLGNLLKKKPGGSLFGNMLRGVANKVTGGILGNGQNKIELGQVQTNAQLAKEQMAAAGMSAPSSNLSNLAGVALGGALPVVAPLGAAALAKKYWWAIAIPVAFLLYKLFVRGNSKTGRTFSRRYSN